MNNLGGNPYELSVLDIFHCLSFCGEMRTTDTYWYCNSGILGGFTNSGYWQLGGVKLGGTAKSGLYQLGGFHWNLIKTLTLTPLKVHKLPKTLTPAPLKAYKPITKLTKFKNFRTPRVGTTPSWTPLSWTPLSWNELDTAECPRFGCKTRVGRKNM